MSKKIFVAIPYNGTTEEKEHRLKILSIYCISLFKDNQSPISPLLMGLMMVKEGNLPTDSETWKIYSETLLKGCDELHILMVNGWENSIGIKYEIEEANKLNIKTHYISI